MSTKSTKPLRIIALTAENVKRLSAVHIEPKGNVVQITGRNRQGKTSVLDSIWWAIEGATHIQASPIRKGAVKARIRLDLGEIIITRRFSAKEDGGYTTSISVESPDGAVFKSPQKLLDDLVGELSFDPLAFATMKPKDQFDALRKFVADVDIEALDDLNRGDRERRTKVGQDLDRERGAAAAITVAAEPPCERIDEAALTKELADVGAHNVDTERRRTNRENMAARVTKLRADTSARLAQIDTDIAAETVNCADFIAEQNAQIEDLEQQIKALQSKIQDRRTRIADRQSRRDNEHASIRQRLQDEAKELTDDADGLAQQLSEAEELPPLKDAAEVESRLNKARESNKALDAWERDRKLKADHQAKAAVHEAEWDRFTAVIAERTQKKQAAIAKAHLPIDGLGFGDGFITLNGQPFEQASDAEQWEASIAIAAALNPRLRVIRVRQGSLLDDDAMKRLEEIAERLDFQVWIERVDGSGTVGFVLEDGHLKGVEALEEGAAA